MAVPRLSVKGRSGGGTDRSHTFGTFGGVFTPDFLTILGVIMYLRLAWVVGNAGFLGAVAIILLAKTVTICTGLSMASITTNIRIGAGGAYSIITKSLGLEAGGSVGIPFYISQTLSAALYIIGFTQGWLRVFPGHPPLAVSLVTAAVLIGISYTSARFAIRVQYIVMVVIVLSIASVALTPSAPNPNLVMMGTFADASFWEVFAVFFPAVTGIMAGANMSGDLRDPRKAIPRGTLSAIFVTMFVYIGLAYVSARYFPRAELRTNEMIYVDNARWGWVVIIGILAATFSSALGSLVGAPRILQALAEHGTVPYHRFFAARSSGAEPRNAIILTGAVVVVAIMFGNLNALASLITMFFLITYGTLNMVVFIQQSMKMISFRPTFKVPRFVSFFGALSCVFIMFLINTTFSIVAIVTIIALYVYLAKKGLRSEGDIRAGIFLVLAERATRIAARLPRHKVVWKPDLLIPVDDPKVWSGSLLFIRSLTSPSGSIFAFTVRDTEVEETEDSLRELLQPLKETDILVNSTIIEDGDFLHGAKLVMQTLKGGAFRPNILFLTIGRDTDNDAVITELVDHAGRHGMGVILLHQMPRTGFGLQKDVNLWLRDESPNWHLGMLMALQLQRNWGGSFNLTAAAADEKERPRLLSFFERMNEQVRLPSVTEFHVSTGHFLDILEEAPRADINIFGLAEPVSLDFLRTVSERTKTSCLFVKDSGHESALV